MNRCIRALTRLPSRHALLMAGCQAIVNPLAAAEPGMELSGTLGDDRVLRALARK